MKIITDNEAAISMSKCNKNTTGNRHVAKQFHYIRLGTVLYEDKFQWLYSNYQIANIQTKVGNKPSFSKLWSLICHQDD